MANFGHILLSNKSEEPTRPSMRWAFSGLTRYFLSQRSVEGRLRLEQIADAARATRIGLELLEVAGRSGGKLAFNSQFEANYARYSGHDKTVMLSPKDRDDILGNLAIHELSHLRQGENTKTKFGDAHYFDTGLKKFADTAYPALIKEADAFTNQVIHAYEMDCKGVPGPWQKESLSYGTRPLTQELKRQLAQGVDPTSDECRQALLLTWLSKSPLRLLYEFLFLDDILTKPFLFKQLDQPGLSHSNEELSELAVNREGNSYLKIDISKPAYLGIWQTFTTKGDLQIAAKGRFDAMIFLKGYLPACEMLDVLEDAQTENKWANLPPSQNAQTLFEPGRLDSFGNKLQKSIKLVTDTPIPNAREKIIELLERARNLSKGDPMISKHLSESIAEAQKALGSRPVRRKEERLNSSGN